MLKSIVWNGKACTTVQSSRSLYAWQTFLYFLSLDLERLQERNKPETVKASKNYWPNSHCNILSSTCKQGLIIDSQRAACTRSVILSGEVSSRTKWIYSSFHRRVISHFTSCYQTSNLNIIYRQLESASVPPWSREGSRRFVVPVPGEGPLPPPVSGERPTKAKPSH